MDHSAVAAFLAVAEEGSFRKASARLGYTQAGISYIIQGLEAETGLNLFLRTRSGVQLSSEGTALLPHFRQLEHDWRQMQQVIQELRGLERGKLRVQIFDSISIHWLPGILQEFQRDFPGIAVELVSEEDSTKAEQMVVSGEVDCGFFLTDVNAAIDVFKLHEESLLAIVAPDHPMASRAVFPVEELGNFPYISMKYDRHTGIQEIFQRNHAVPATAYCMDNDHAAMAMVSKGLGYCIFPELLLQDISYPLRCLEFDRPQRRTIRVGTRSVETASKACLKFIEYTRRWVAEHYPPAPRQP